MAAVIEWIIERGRPILVAADVTPMPETVEKIRRSFDAAGWIPAASAGEPGATFTTRTRRLRRRVLGSTPDNVIERAAAAGVHPLRPAAQDLHGGVQEGHARSGVERQGTPPGVRRVEIAATGGKERHVPHPTQVLDGAPPVGVGEQQAVEVGGERRAVPPGRHVADAEVRHHAHAELLGHHRRLTDLQCGPRLPVGRGRVPEGLPVTAHGLEALRVRSGLVQHPGGRGGEAAPQLEVQLTDLLRAGALHGPGRVRREAQAARLPVLGDQPLQARLVDRDLAVPERPDLLLVDVRAGDVVAGLREAGAHDQAHVARADDRDVHVVRGVLESGLCGSSVRPGSSRRTAS